MVKRTIWRWTHTQVYTNAYVLYLHVHTTTYIIMDIDARHAGTCKAIMICLFVLFFLSFFYSKCLRGICTCIRVKENNRIPMCGVFNSDSETMCRMLLYAARFHMQIRQMALVNSNQKQMKVSFFLLIINKIVLSSTSKYWNTLYWLICHILLAIYIWFSGNQN